MIDPDDETKLIYGDYRSLEPYEYVAICHYMDRCYTTYIEALIRQGYVGSKGMRDFIADIVAGKVKRKKHKTASTEHKDMAVYMEVYYFVREGYPLKPRNGDSAISKTAEKLFPGQDKEHAVEAAYKRIKKAHNLSWHMSVARKNRKRVT